MLLLQGQLHPLGETLPPEWHALALGKVLLAFGDFPLPPPPPKTPHTPTDPPAPQAIDARHQAWDEQMPEDPSDLWDLLAQLDRARAIVTQAQHDHARL